MAPPLVRAESEKEYTHQGKSQLPVSRETGQVLGPPSLPDSASTITAFGRSRPAADASREVVECWLLDGLR